MKKKSDPPFTFPTIILLLDYEGAEVEWDIISPTDFLKIV